MTLLKEKIPWHYDSFYWTTAVWVRGQWPILSGQESENYKYIKIYTLATLLGTLC